MTEAESVKLASEFDATDTRTKYILYWNNSDCRYKNTFSIKIVGSHSMWYDGCHEHRGSTDSVLFQNDQYANK